MRISPLFYPMSAPLNGPLVRAAGRAMRAAAASLEAAGLALQGRKLTEERRESGSTRRGSCSQDARTARARGWPPSRHAGIRPALSRRLPSAVVPSVRWVPLSARASEAGGRGAAAPEAARGVWLASTAACVGDVKLGEQSSAWYGALLNGACAAARRRRPRRCCCCTFLPTLFSTTRAPLRRRQAPGGHWRGLGRAR